MAMYFEPRIRGPILIVATVMLTGCTSVDPGMGEALKYDMAIQTIDPDPVYPEGGAQPGGNGEKASDATERYRKGAVKDVQAVATGGPG